MITETEILRRRDVREALTFTIDPTEAKDFDDALSFEEREDGSYVVGVHIADVTYYVRPNEETDRQAYEQATSIYLVDRVLPMLPEELCNDICSLRPNEDKLCMSVIFTMDATGRVLKHKICRTVIRSRSRLTYEQAQAIIDSEDGVLPEVVGEVVSEEFACGLSRAIHRLNQLAQILRNRRIAAGALTVEQDEPHFQLDENNHPTAIYFTSPQPANHLIEEFMLLANRTVAEEMGRTGKQMVYRVHDKPDEEKMDSLEKFRKRMGDKVLPATLDMLSIRAMAKAVYSTDNIGHYGLAFDYYTHFTSPIRRYPDMMVHRLVAKYLLGERRVQLPDDLEEICQHCSDMEQYATQEERNSIKEMQAIWIGDHINEEFDGTISGVTDFGLFVTLDDNRCDGLVPIRTIRKGTFLEYDEKNYSLHAYSVKGKRGSTRFAGREPIATYTLGDKVRVRVVRANPEYRQIDFCLAEGGEDE